MNDRYRPRAQPDIPQLRLAAEVQVVEVKIEPLVEPQIVHMKRRTVGDQQHPVQQLDLLAGRPVESDVLRREAFAVPDRAAEILLRVALKIDVSEIPGGLVRKPPFVARDA